MSLRVFLKDKWNPYSYKLDKWSFKISFMPLSLLKHNYITVLKKETLNKLKR